MNSISPGQVTQLLNQAGAGDPHAVDRLVDLTYEELQQVARRLMSREGNHTLQPTALLNEALQRILSDGVVQKSPNRAYFFAAAAQAMRRCLVDAARRRRSKKAGGERDRVPFENLLDVYEQRSLDLLALDVALGVLNGLNPRQHQIVDLRWFGGFTVPDIAEMLEVSVSTVESDWRLARAFLLSRVSEEEYRDG